MHTLTRSRLRPAPAVGAAVLAFAAAGCGAGAGGDAARVPVSELATIVPFEADELLHDVRDVGVDGQGRTWVLSGLEPHLRTYAPDGRLVRRFGRRGKGPGEATNPWSLLLAGGASSPVGVWDVGLRRLTWYSPDGVPLGTDAVDVPPNTVRADMPDVTYGTVDVARAWNGELVLQDEPVGVTQPSHILYSRLLRLNRSGRTVATLVDFRRRFGRQIERLGQVTTMVPLPLWTTCADGSLIFLDPFAPSLVWLDRAGRPAATVRLRPSGRAIASSDRRRYLAHVIALEYDGQLDSVVLSQRVNRAVHRLRRQFGTEQPPAVSLLCDARGRAWLQQFSTEESPLGYSREWMVVDREGERRRVRFPSGFQPRVFTRDAAVGVRTDSLDVQQIAKVPL